MSGASSPGHGSSASNGHAKKRDDNAGVVQCLNNSLNVSTGMLFSRNSAMTGIIQVDVVEHYIVRTDSLGFQEHFNSILKDRHKLTNVRDACIMGHASVHVHFSSRNLDFYISD